MFLTHDYQNPSRAQDESLYSIIQEAVIGVFNFSIALPLL
jgi:hypothetical protein